MRILGGSLLIAALALTAAAQEAEPVGVYGLIDRVTFQTASGEACAPPQCQPNRILILGVFALADPKLADTVLENGQGYLPAARGYLYFKVLKDAEHDWGQVTREEWERLAATAGNREAIGFGLRYAAKTYPIHLRKIGDAPGDPDGYISANCAFTNRMWDWNPDRILAFQEGLFTRPEDYRPVKAVLDYHE
jgi:hypothetical protein